MATRDAEVAALRASDADRERALVVLRDGVVAGRLSHETFLGRVDRALTARSSSELADLVADLRPDARRGLLSSVDAALRAATLRRHPRLTLPPVGRGGYTIGRDPACDLVLSDETVSRRHACLRHATGVWTLADLDSKNGTLANGWRVRAGGLPVRSGDLVTFGRLTFHLT